MNNAAPLWFLLGLVVTILVLRQVFLFLLARGRNHDFLKGLGAIPGGGWLVERARAAGVRFPAVRDALKRRVALDRFTGLPLSLLVVLGLAVLLLAGEVIQSLLHAGDVIHIDDTVHEAFTAVRAAPVISFFVFITFYGTVPFMLGATAIISLLLVIFDRLRYLVPLWFTIGGSTLATWGGKYLVDRPRPEFVTHVIETSPSFPSGHATAAMATYGFLAYLSWREAPTPRLKFECAFGLVVIIGLLGLSRLVLGVHYFSDITVGYLIGLFFLLIGIGLAEWSREMRPSRP